MENTNNIEFKYDEEIWDDSVILEAFNSALKQKKRKSKKKVPIKVQEESIEESTEEQDIYVQAYNDAYASIYEQFQQNTPPPKQSSPQPNPFQMPSSQQGNVPLPPSAKESELSQMLLAWYYSGYYTGRYEALQERR